MTLKNLYDMTEEECEWIHENISHQDWKSLFREFFGLSSQSPVSIEVLEDFIISYRWHWHYYHEQQIAAFGV